MTSKGSKDIKPVFFDNKGRRRRFFDYSGIVAAAIVTVLTAFFAASILINPFLPQLRLKPLSVLPQAADISPALPEKPPLTKQESLLRQSSEKAKAEKLKREEAKRNAAIRREMFITEQRSSGFEKANDGKQLAVGFYVNWDDSSIASLKQNINKLDWIVPEWIRLSGDGANPLILDIDDRAMDLIQLEKPNLQVLPLLQNYKDKQWNSDILINAIATDKARKRLIAAILDTVAKNNFGGITVDIEEVPPEKQPNLYEFVEELHGEFQKRNLILAQAVPFDNPDWDYGAYAAVTDYLMLMAYDQHWAGGKPGPISGQDWFDSTLKKRLADLSPAKTIVCFGNYGYNWTEGETEAEDITFQQALLTAKESLDSPADISFDQSAKNPYFEYTEDDGKNHSVWFLDAVTAYNQIRSAEKFGFAGMALWRLGSEDPSVWKIFGSGTTASSSEALSNIKYGYDVDFEGTGEILQVVAEPSDGARDIKENAEGFVTNEIYRQAPSPYVVQRTGDKVGKIALTFDDGPDPAWTPKILDILKQENVQATFFVVGENGQANPDLIRRINDEGHEIGNHSFTHPNLGVVPRQVIDLELNTTQRLIESLTGRSTRLFRAPYFGDAEPQTPDEIGPTVIAQNLGYISVGLRLDPGDWKLKNDDGSLHTADQIAEKVLQDAAVTTLEERGEVVLLHDSGGDRSATVEALPKIIRELKSRGFVFTTISDLADISRDQAMPQVPKDQSFYVKADSYVFYSLSMGSWLMRWLFLIGIVLGIGRMLVIGILALAQYIRSRRRESAHFGETYQPHVSVIVPAYNEEKVICRTVESLLTADYKNFDVVIVDDGSTDQTYKIISERFMDHPLVTIFTKQNGGKAEALNYGWRQAKGDVIVALDADTIFTPQTISALARRFADPAIGAVAGNAKVGNRINIVTKWQALEYVTSQNFDRRAFASLNCITVVPGAVGAWRHTVLEETGGFSSDTLAEDQDLTIQVRKHGYQIGYEETAIGLTEAPDSLRNLAKQRFRWAFGTLQCLWKHKNALFNPKYGTLGFIAMPNAWIFQIFFPLVSPLMDLMFLWTLVGALIGYLEHQQEYASTSSNLNEVLFYYALFLAVDWLGATAAFLMEKAEQKKLLWWLFIQRFGYRQVMYWVVVKAVYAAIRGALVGWGKLERKATVEAQV